MSENWSEDDSKQGQRLNGRQRGSYDGVLEAAAEDGLDVKDGTQQKTLRAFSHPANVGAESFNDENTPVGKRRRVRKTRHFSSGTSALAVAAIADSVDEGTSRSNNSRQRYKSHQHHHHSGYNGKAFHRTSVYKHRQKHADQTRSYNRFAKFHAGGDGEGNDFVHSQYQPPENDFRPSKAPFGEERGLGGPAAVGAVTVDTDVIYKTFKTKKQTSLPAQASLPVIIQAGAASASFTASSLVPLSVLSRSLSIFAGGSGEKKGQDQAATATIKEDGPAPPSRQTSEGAAVASLDDRTAFHKTFSLLVQLGAEASSRRVHHYGGGGSGVGGTCPTTPALSLDSRDGGDSSEPSSLRQQQIVLFSDILWIYFQARRFNRKLPCCFQDDLAAWLRDQDNLIYEQRLQEGAVLIQILSFLINSEERIEITSPPAESDQEAPATGELFGSHTSSGQYDAIASQLRLEDRALEEVCQVLSRFEHFQSLYKSSAAMESSLGEAYSSEVKHRLNVLYGWSNIASDLRRKLFTIGEMLEIRKYKARKDSLASTRASSDGVSRSTSSDPGSLEARRKSTAKSPAAKNNESPIFLNTPRSANSPLVTRTGSNSLSVTACTAMDIIAALSDTEYLKSYAEKCLKLRGMRKVLSRVAVIYGHSLWRARQLLQRRCTMTPLASFWKLGDASDSPSSPFLRLHKSTLLECETDLARCHVDDESYRAMGLPPSFPVYLTLLRIPLDLVYVWLTLRLELRTSREPDRMTTNQLIQDARDCLEAATEVKTFYQDYIQAVVDDPKHLEELLVNEMGPFEKALQDMFELYLRYVHRWVEYQCMSGVGTRGISREQNQTVMKFLEEEWKFAKRISINVLFGEAEAAQKFCHMNTAILKNMEELLENSLDETRNRQYEDDCKSEIEEDNEIEADFLSSSSLSSEDDHRSTTCHSTHSKSDYGEDRALLLPTIATSPPRKSSSVLEQCRRLRTIVNELRNLANRSVALAKLLRHDLEIAAKFQLTDATEALLKRLQETGHYLLKTPSRNSSSEFFVFCNAKAARKEAVLQFLLNVTCGRDDRFCQMTSAHADLKLNGSYVLLVKGGRLTASVWTGLVKEVMPNADSNFALHHMDVDGIYMVMGETNQLREQATAFSNYVGADCLKLIDEQCSCHSVVAENMNEMKSHAMQMRQRLAEWLKSIATELKYDRPLNELEDVERQNYRDALIQAYSVAFEYHRELMRLINAAMENDVARSLADFALQWCQFITEVCDEGQGCRPRWATDGINYLAQVADAKVTAHLDDLEFEDLKKVMLKCLNHVIGSKSNASKPSLGGHRISLLESPASASNCPSRNGSRVSLPGMATESKCGLRSSPSSARSSRDDLQSENSENESYSKRAMRQIRHQEHKREEYLRRELKLIGRCVERNEVQAAVQMPLKRAGFRWQRLQHFVGRGRFGSVHTALNLDTGQLMAVKQLKLVRKQDHQAMQHLMDEVTNFSKIQHPNLVRYFGAEVHQDEILIFMEYCNEGTLAEACKDVMSEEIVRFYTLSLLQAIGELHKHNIVHRDIKPANIFLANEHRSLKLGDFGSSVRLQGDETMVGELTVYIGTPAYMAPEVCTGVVDGYGRAADIWSLGCVVLEMMTGKPPWHDLPEPMSIVYRVGMGGVPDIPSCFTSECSEFLRHCLVNKPSERWGVDRLLELTLVKVKAYDTNV